MKQLTRALAGSILAIASLATLAAPTQTVVQTTDYGLLSVPYTQNFGLTLVPMAADHTFLSDYGFTIGSAGTLTSAVVTFDLGSVFQLSALTLTLLSGPAWTGAVPADLSGAQVADRDSRILKTGTGMPSTQTLEQVALAPGHYTIEVSGHVAGTSGGSFGGLFNVAAVPEPSGIVLALAGFGLLALRRRRTPAP